MVPFRSPPARGQVAEDLAERPPAVDAEEPGDVLHEEEPGSHVLDQLPERGPEPSDVGGAGALAGDAGALAGDAGTDEIHAAAPRAAVEGLEIVPYRNRIHGASLHLMDDSGNREGLPLDKTHKAQSRDSKPDSQLEAEEPAADGEAGSGRFGT